MESELDKLIDLFEENKISRGSESNTNSSIAVSEKKVASSLDDALDDLLAEASLLDNNQSSDGAFSKKDKMEALDESIDDLLGQSVVAVKKDKRIGSSVDALSSSVPAKQVDDFDSWFDSL
jgi:hypothetical protein